MLATLLYARSMQDQRGLAFTCQRVRSLVEPKCRGRSYWWTWFWMRYQGNPYARLPFKASAVEQAPCRERRTPKALQLVRKFIEPIEA